MLLHAFQIADELDIMLWLLSKAALERNEILVKHIYYDIENNGLTSKENDMKWNYRFIEPPIVVYYVTTTDQYGNINVAPVSLGTHMGFGEGNGGGRVGYYTFSLVHTETGRGNDADTAWTTAPRDSSFNLDANGECVISYCTKRQMKEMRIAGCPIPTGIDEGEIAGFSYFKSEKVNPPCIADCPVNMEAKIVFSKVFGDVKLYVCKVVALHVDEYYDKLDKETAGHPGLILTDPIFEIYLEGDVLFGNRADDGQDTLRMKLATMGADTPFLQEPKNIGPRRKWLGTFTMWMKDELEQGNISENEYTEIMSLYCNWGKDMNPKTNGDTKKALTEWVKEIVWHRNP